MTYLIGEFDCKLDAKGRLMLPVALKKQLTDVEKDGLVINRGFEGNLVLYPKSKWNDEMAKIMQLNTYVPENRKFVREFQRGASELSVDSAGRVLLPKTLLDDLAISADVVLACQVDKIEVWDKKKYDELFNGSPEDFAALAQKVMGSLGQGGADGK